MTRSFSACALLILILSFGCTQNAKHEPAIKTDTKALTAETTSVGTPEIEPAEAIDWNTDEYIQAEPNVFHSPLSEPLYTFSLDGDTASYSIIRNYLNHKQVPAAGSVRPQEVINYFSYDYPQSQSEHPFSVYTELGDCPWDSGRQLVQIALQAQELDPQSAPAINLVLLLDTSFSPAAEEKLSLMKTAMKLLVKQLRAQDKVAIVAYDSSARVVLESVRTEEKELILQAIDALTAKGGNAGGEGLKLAYKTALENMIRGGNNRVIFCTDGDFNVGVSSTAELKLLVEEHRDRGISLSILGFGQGNYKDNRLKTLAAAGNGNYAYIDSEQEAQKLLVDERMGTLYTLAKDVKLQVEFNPAHVKAYRLIGNEGRRLNNEDFLSDRVDAGELGAGRMLMALFEVIPADSESEAPAFNQPKYQELKPSAAAQKSPELMNVKINYKPLLGSSGITTGTTLNCQASELTENFHWSAAAAAYALSMQKSKHVPQLRRQLILDLAQKSKGADFSGYRAELIELLKQAANLSGEHLD